MLGVSFLVIDEYFSGDIYLQVQQPQPSLLSLWQILLKRNKQKGVNMLYAKNNIHESLLMEATQTNTSGKMHSGSQLNSPKACIYRTSFQQETNQMQQQPIQRKGINISL